MQPEEVAGTTSLKVRQARPEAEGRSKVYQHDQGGQKEDQGQHKTRQNKTKSGSVSSGLIKTASRQDQTEQDKVRLSLAGSGPSQD